MKIFRAAVLFALLVGVALASPAQAAGDVNCKDGRLLNGYQYKNFCVPGYITNDFWFGKSPPYTVAKAVYYAPGKMEATAKWREMDCTGFVDCVSLQFAGDIGEIVWLRRPGHGWEGPFLVADSSQRNHLYYHAVYIKEHVEVGFKTAVRWGMAAETATSWKNLKWTIRNVEVYKGLQPPSANEEPVEFSKWVRDNAEFEKVSISNNRVWNHGEERYSNFQEYRVALEGNRTVVKSNIQSFFVPREPFSVPRRMFYVPRSTTSASLYTIKVTAKALNVRNGPGPDHSWVVYAHKDDVLEVYEEEGNWLRVSDGWIYAYWTTKIP